MTVIVAGEAVIVVPNILGAGAKSRILGLKLSNLLCLIARVYVLFVCLYPLYKHSVRRFEDIRTGSLCISL